MPVLKDFRNEVQITLPNFPDSKIICVDSLLVKDLSGLNMKSLENPTIDVLMKLLPRFIRSWNFSDEDGKMLEVNAENLSLLPIDDLTLIYEGINKGKEAGKKE